MMTYGQPDSTAADRPLREGYWAETQRPLYSLLFVAPMLVAYEIGLTVGRIDSGVLARSHIQVLLAEVGAAAEYLSAMLIVAVLLAWHVAGRHAWRVNAAVLIGMALEAAVLAIPLRALSLLSNQAVAMSAAAEGPGVVQVAFTRVGAGIYEEFFFRLVWLSLASLLLADLLSVPKDIAAAVAVVTSAAAFAAHHFWGAGPIVWWKFAFFFIAGGYLAAIYLLRGFGIAVGAHVLYNLIALALDGPAG